MPPKRSKTAGRKGKQPVNTSVTKDSAEAAASNATEQKEDATRDESTLDSRPAANDTAAADTQPEAQLEPTPNPVEEQTQATSGEGAEAPSDVPSVEPPSKRDTESQPATKSSTSKKSTTFETDVEEGKEGEQPSEEAGNEPAVEAKAELDATVEDKTANSNKRKAAGTPRSDKAPKKKSKKEPKVAREGHRKSGRAAQKPEATPVQILNYLLTDAAADLCRPDDEAKDIQERGSDIKTYSTSVLSPFEELLCALILSRPISHRLGLRTIRTLLNDPYNFTTPKSITSAGREKTRQALEDAHTQHKDKTAEQISMAAEVISSKFTKDGDGDDDSSLEKVREEGNKDWDDERDLLQSNIKGLGKTGLDIFFRRTQWLWEESFPFIDERTARGVDKLGLPKNADKLFELLKQNWEDLDTENVSGGDDDDEAAKIRRAFVVVCERATGAELEDKSQAVLEAAASS